MQTSPYQTLASFDEFKFMVRETVILNHEEVQIVARELWNVGFLPGPFESRKMYAIWLEPKNGAISCLEWFKESELESQLEYYSAMRKRCDEFFG